MRRRNPVLPRPSGPCLVSGPALCLALCLALCFAAGLLSARRAAAGDDTARFLRALDGDSLRVVFRGCDLEVRLIGVDAPEYRQEYSRKAREFTQRFCQGRTLHLEFDQDPRDRYGRTLAYVRVDGLMLNEELVRAGLAIPLRVKPNTRYAARFRQAEKEARRQQRGFWSKGGLDMTPAQWRRTHPRK